MWHCPQSRANDCIPRATSPVFGVVLLFVYFLCLFLISFLFLVVKGVNLMSVRMYINVDDVPYETEEKTKCVFSAMSIFFVQVSPLLLSGAYVYTTHQSSGH